jgi:PrtD family type I secretion system ABC transporter
LLQRLTNRRQTLHSSLAAAMTESRRAFWGVVLFSAIVNILVMAGPIYMLQVYDRVLASRSVPTLIALTIFLVGAYAFQGVLDMIRSRIVVRMGALLDQHMGETVHRAVIALGAHSGNAAEAHQPIRDLDQIRAFATGPGPTAIADLPWIPFFLAICFLIHPWIGYLSLAGAIILIALTVQTERASRGLARSVSESGSQRTAMAEAGRRNVASTIALGMRGALANRWAKVNDRYVEAIGQSSDVVNSYGSVTKVMRLLMQSAILGLGAYLVIRQEMSPGAMIAASIMMGRALAPIEVAIGNWRGFVAARDSVQRLSATLLKLPANQGVTDLPKPNKDLAVETVTVAAPGATTAILTNINFRLTAGEVLGVIGPNGSGKSSLARVMMGIWPAARGTVRLDGAALNQWEPDTLGRHLGFMSQMVELFPGTVAENIARMAPEPDSAEVLRAAQAAGAHDMILRLPGGYDTPVGDGGSGLSVGQQQRIAMARALYGDPFLVLLDEPSANLDGEGEAALQEVVNQLKARRAIVVLIVHRRSSLALCDKVLVLLNGQQRDFGPRDEVLRKMAGPALTPAPSVNLKVVGDQTKDDRS